MNYYEKNLECIRQNKKYLYDQIQIFQKEISKSNLEKISSVDAKDGSKSLIILINGNEHRLNSSYFPVNEAKKWAEQFNFNNLNTVITMFGLGNGIFARELMKKRNVSDTIVIYEPCSDIFFYTLQHYDLTDLFNEKRLSVIVEGINDLELKNVLEMKVDLTNFFSQIHCIHPKYDLIFAQSYISYLKVLKDNNNHARIMINTEMHFGKRYIINTLRNLRHLRNSSRLLDYSSMLDEGIPAIVVAAGPSLKANIDELKRAKGKAYLFVVDRILDYVLDEGIVPDFIVTVDPIKPLEYFTKRTNLTIPLLCKLDSNWEVLDRHKGKKIVYSCDLYLAKMYQKFDRKPPLLDTGASVATAAFAACMQLGFEKIILVGQDLAYDGEVTHAGGVAEKLKINGDVFVEGIDGNQVRSRYDWYEFLRWFQDKIAANPELKVIDAKDKGAKIKGTVVMSLKEAVELYCTKESNLTDFESDETLSFNEVDMEKVKQYFEDNCKDIEKLKNKAEEAIEICDQQINEFKTNNNESYLSIENYKKLTEINHSIGEMPIYNLLESYITAAAASQLSGIYQFTDDEKTDKIRTYEKSKDIFKAILDAIKFVQPLMEEVIGQI
jgi:hypothetical protein